MGKREQAELEQMRRRVEALERAQETLLAVLDTLPQRVFWKDRSLHYLGGNRPFAADAGLADPKDVAGMTDDELPWRELAHVYRADDEEVLRKGVEKRDYEEPVVVEGGEMLWVRTTKVPLRGPGGEIIGVFGCVEDITDRIRADEALRQSEERFRTLVQQASDGIFIADLSGKYIEVNAAGCAMLGYTREELLAMNLRDLLPEGEFEREPPRFDLLEAGETVLSERQLRAKDGRILDVEMSSKIIAGGYLQGLVRDISERKRANTQRRRLTDELRQAQRLESVGRLAGGVAHDFNNLLSVIVGGCHLVRKSLPDATTAHRDLDDILGAAEAAASLTHQLLAFSKHQVLEPERLDLREIVESRRPVLERLVGDAVELVVDVGSAPAVVEADRAQLEQVVLNLAVNARDAMPSGGRVEITVDRARPTEAELERSPGLSPVEHVCLRVRDTGEGIDPDLLPHVFEPFFSTKEPGEGTGLGLATVYGIVSQSGGLLRVESTPGAGTTFEVLLPERPPDTRVQPAPAPTQPRGETGRTIIVVEDEDVLRSMLRRILEGEGYTLLVAESGEDALLESRRHPGTIDLLVTDVMMSGMTGIGLAHRLEEERPGIAVLLISGYAGRTPTAGDRLLGRPFLAKPFTATALLDRVAAILRDRPKEPRGQPTG